jgi:hypothetical protein
VFVLTCTVVVLTCSAMYGCVCVDVLVIFVFVFTVFCVVCTLFFVLFRICIFVFVFYIRTRDAQIPDVSSPGRLNFVLQPLMLLALSTELTAFHASGSRILKWLIDFWNICDHVLNQFIPVIFLRHALGF